MTIGRNKEELSVMEAVDILSNMSEVDLKGPIDLDSEEEGISLRSIGAIQGMPFAMKGRSKRPLGCCTVISRISSEKIVRFSMTRKR